MIGLTLTLLALASSAPRHLKAGGGAHRPATAAALPRPVVIDAEHLQVFDRKGQLVWSGHVRAKRDDVNLTCERLVAFYTGSQDNITRLTCDGNVQVVEGNRWGKSEHADFDNLTGVLVFTGSPEARQGVNRIRGRKITFHTGTDQIDVERAAAVIESDADGRPALPGAPAAGKQRSP